MALYLVLHHPKAPDQRFANAWDRKDSNKIIGITTTKEIAELCQAARNNKQTVYIHRCAWGDHQPVICSSVSVAEVKQIDKWNAYVGFVTSAILDVIPLKTPILGQSFYFA